MITFLSDHDIEGQAGSLWKTLKSEGWLELVPLRLVTFKEVGLPSDSSDQVVWQFAQINKMILLTANRQMKEPESLAQTIRTENTLDSLPVITLANADRMNERAYRERCAESLVDTILSLDNFRGVGRIFIP